MTKKEIKAKMKGLEKKGVQGKGGSIPKVQRDNGEYIRA